jgi:UDP:flavonoid glycosyltransferase YjiC (YdhE family)
VVVTCSTEYQDDGEIVVAALAGLEREPVRVVATTAAVDPSGFRAPPNARVERFLPHGLLLREAACVVCHGGMGFEQKALAAGVPLCVVPFGRDQVEVARHVERAGAGTTLPRRRLDPRRLAGAVRRAMTRRDGAMRVAEAFRSAGGAVAAADEIEALTRTGSTSRESAAAGAP